MLTMKLIKTKGEESLLPEIQRASYSRVDSTITLKRYVIDEQHDCILITDTLTLGEHEKVFFMNAAGNTIAHYKGAML